MNRFVTALIALCLCAPAAFGIDYAKNKIWIGPSEIDDLPMTGPAWDLMLCYSAQSFNWTDANHEFYPNLSNTDNNSDVLALAKALVYVRTGGQSGSYANYRCEIRGAISGGWTGCCTEYGYDCFPANLIGTECWGGSSQTDCEEGQDAVLPVARNLTCWVIAAGLVGLTSVQDNQVFIPWLSTMQTKLIGTNANIDTLTLTNDRRPNNHGTVAGAARVAIAWYLADDEDMIAAAATFKKYTGEEPSAWYSGSGGYGATCWRSGAAIDRGINEVNATLTIQDLSGRNVDGVLWDDQRRCGGTAGGSLGCYCSIVGADACLTCSEDPDDGAQRWDIDFDEDGDVDPGAGPWKQGYVYAALQGAVVQAWILQRGGYDAFNWGGAALKRAFVWLDVIADFPAGGDDRFLTWIVEHPDVYNEERFIRRGAAMTDKRG